MSDKPAIILSDEPKRGGYQGGQDASKVRPPIKAPSTARLGKS